MNCSTSLTFSSWRSAPARRTSTRRASTAAWWSSSGTTSGTKRPSSSSIGSRAQLLPAAHFQAGTQVDVGGAPAQGADFLARTYGGFPWVVLVVAGVAYILLLRAFRSLLLPLIAVLLDALSVAASYGLLVVLFRFGAGADVLGLYRSPQIEGWAPVFLFAMLFGLSMDYEVFFVTRMRESWDKGADNARAVVDGLSQTGRVVSVAAVVMVGALAGLMAGRVAGLQELGAGLALGVLLDATVVRGMLMPSLMALAGRWNWWLPPVVARAVRVGASPLAARSQSYRSYGLKGGAGSSSSATRTCPFADPLASYPAAEGRS